MKQRLRSLRFRMVLPVVAMTMFVVILLTSLFSRAYNGMILKQEQQVNAVGFETISRSVRPLFDSSLSRVRGILADNRITSYVRLQYTSASKKVHARIDVRDYLLGEISRQDDAVYGLLFMRKDGSLFGVLPEGNLFLDDPKENPLQEKIKTQILNIPHGQTAWIGPVSGAEIYGFQNDTTPQHIMIAVLKSVNIIYGECYVLLLVDESVFDSLFDALQDGKSTWHVFTANQAEIYHAGQELCGDADMLISKSNSGEIFSDENGNSVCAFSMTMDSPAWTIVREVSMEENTRLIRGVRRSVAVLAILIFLIALAIYELWQRKFMRQFNTLLKGITRMGQNDAEPITSKPSSISEFRIMQEEINHTSLALNEQMRTIQKMTAEKERINTEMNLAREIQAAALPSVFPAFPDRPEIDLYASMRPAKEVGGDFYDFFLTDEDHLALIIADVSGKGIPAALFMMTAKDLIKNHLMNGCDPAQALQRVNVQFSKENATMMFVTVWLAVVELSTGKGLACNAGHEKPALRRAGGEYELLVYTHNPLVGGLKKARYQNREFELHPGDSLFEYTDGVTEATNPAGEMFREKRLVETLNRYADAEPEELVRRVRDEVDRFADSAEQFDDITMLCFRYCGAERQQTEEDG